MMVFASPRTLRVGGVTLLVLCSVLHSIIFIAGRSPVQLPTGYYDDAFHSLRTNNESGNVYAVFATDCLDTQYASLALLSAYVWKHHLNVTPVVFIHAPPSRPGLDMVAQFLIKGVEGVGGQAHLVTSRPGDRVSTTMQNLRLVAFQHVVFQPNDMIVTADADIWPLSPNFWQPVLQNQQDRVFIYNGPFYNSQRAKGSDDFVAMSFVAAPVRYWRKLYRRWCEHNNSTAFEPGRIYQTLWQVLDTGIRYQSRERWDGESVSSKQGPQWSWDQIMLGIWLDTSHQCPDHCVINAKVERLDRSSWQWNEQGEYDDFKAVRMFTDAHLPFPLSDEDVYQKLERVWRALFGSTSVITDVRNRIVEISGDMEKSDQ